MRDTSLQQKRNRQILADIVQVFIETGEPVSSRTIAEHSAEPLSSATIRNVMAELEEEGYLYQPHTSAGRVPTAAAFRLFVQGVANQAAPQREDLEWIRKELAAATTPEQLMERASHVLAKVSQGLGIIVSPPLAASVVEHIRFVELPESRVLVVVISVGGLTRDKVVQLERGERPLRQQELDRIAAFVNSEYKGWTLDAMRADLTARVEKERERYDRLAAPALALTASDVLGDEEARTVYVEGAAQMAAAFEFADPGHLSGLLEAIEGKRRLIDLLTGAIETPEPVHIQIGVKGIAGGGDQLSLISAPYTVRDRAQGTLGVLGPMRMHYERAIAAVACVAQLFNEDLHRS